MIPIPTVPKQGHPDAIHLVWRVPQFQAALDKMLIT